MNLQNEYNNFQFNNQPGQHPVFEMMPRAKKKRKWVKPFFAVIAVIFLILIIILSPAVVNGYLVYKKVDQLKVRVEPTMAYIKDANWNEVNKNLSQTKEDLGYIKEKINHLGLIGYLPVVEKKVVAADHILGASVKLLNGFDEIITLVSSVDVSSTNENGVASQLGQGGNKKQLLDAISKNRDAFDKISINLKEAKDELALVSANDLFGNYGNKFETLFKSLSKVVDDSQMALPILKQLPEILGNDKEKTYLIVFENNMEMRATGGFIGSYGIVKVKDGEVTYMFTDDIYNLDKHSKDKLNAIAPAPVQAYLKQKYWYMRDSNWSPDWPTSANQLVWFFNKEREIANLPYLPVDGVIAITPDLISDMISLIGELEVYGVKFNAENFALDLEQFVEFDYEEQGIPVHERKSIIGPMAQIIMERIEAMPPSNLLNLWSVMKKSIDEKHVLIYLTDKNLENYFMEHNWAGSMAQVDNDYIMVVDSNMAALKTDVVMKKAIAYNLKADSNGKLIGTLHLTYNHEGKYQKDLISMYRDYMRVYLPHGTEIKNVKLIDQNKETNLKREDLIVYNELGKTVLGLFFTVDIGKFKKIIIEYELPQNINMDYQNGLYKLFVQKQAGTSGHNLQINLEFKKRVSAYDYISTPSNLGGNSINWNTDLSKDRIFGLKLN